MLYVSLAPSLLAAHSSKFDSGCVVCCVQLGHYGGMADEIDSLKRDKNVLMLELVRLRQQQQVSRPGRGKVS
jgi:hypothetical protein